MLYDAMPADVRLARLEQHVDVLDAVLADVNARLTDLAERVAWLERDNATRDATLGADLAALERRLASVERWRADLTGDGVDLDAEHGGDDGGAT